jgi:hypothetical protein
MQLGRRTGLWDGHGPRKQAEVVESPEVYDRCSGPEARKKFERPWASAVLPCLTFG